MNQLGFAVFFLVLSAVLVLLNRHALAWITRAFAPSPLARRALIALLASSLAAMMLGRVFDWVWTEAPVKWLLVYGGTVQLAVLMAVILLLPVDLGRLVTAIVRRVQRARASQAAVPAGAVTAEVVERVVPPAETVPRRALLAQAAAGSAFLIAGSSSLYGVLIGRHDYSIEDVPIRIPGLSRALDGFTIVQLSDIHIGQFVAEPELAAAEEMVRRARPDLIVLTGDLVDHDAALADRLGAFVRRLVPLAREGVTAISGNHDYFAGITPVVRALEAGGADVLRNRGRVVGSGRAAFALLGVDDVWARRRGGGPDLVRAIASVRPLAGSAARARDLPRILLCHNPSYFEHAAGKVALQLSGHTHGGQVQLVVNPAEWFVKRGWVRGRYEQHGSELYVNRGFGTVGPPARVGSPPEITRIVLTA